MEDMTVYPCLYLDGCFQGILQLAAFSCSCVLRHLQSHLPCNLVPTLLSSLMLYGTIPRSPHSFAPPLIHVEEETLSTVSDILRFLKCKMSVKHRLAVLLGCRVHEVHCKGGLDQASNLEGYKDILSNTLPSKQHPSCQWSKQGLREKTEGGVFKDSCKTEIAKELCEVTKTFSSPAFPDFRSLDLCRFNVLSI